MSNIFTDLVCNKCGAETLTEEFYLDGYTEYCSSCGYLKESFLTEEEYKEYILLEENTQEDTFNK